MATINTEELNKKARATNTRLYWRIQESGISFEDMKAHKSVDGGNYHDDPDEAVHEGLCASDSPYALKQYAKYILGEGMEIVAYLGEFIDDVNDGFDTKPVMEVARFDAEQFFADDDLMYDWDDITDKVNDLK